MITVCCLRWGNRYSKEYVSVLEKQVYKYLNLPHRFVCLTERPQELSCDTIELPSGLPTWWGKVYLFKKGMFKGRVLYLDLDVCITNSLDELVEIPSPFGIIEDWHVPGFNSSVMVWDADTCTQIWDDFSKEVMQTRRGDQDWITECMPMAAVFPPKWCVSYRGNAVPGVPKGAKVVVFHGSPKPHELTSPWIKDYWQ